MDDRPTKNLWKSVRIWAIGSRAIGSQIVQHLVRWLPFFTIKYTINTWVWADPKRLSAEKKAEAV